MGRSAFGSRWDPETDEVRNPDPYDYGDAKRALARASREISAAADLRVECARKYAEAEKAYRIALSQEIIVQRDAGAAWAVAADLARGQAKVAQLRMERDIAEGMKDAAEQISWKASGDRKAVEQLVTWSMRLAPDGQYEQRAGT